eukprot:4631262-Amphidinium_carterae.1
MEQLVSLAVALSSATFLVCVRPLHKLAFLNLLLNGYIRMSLGLCFCYAACNSLPPGVFVLSSGVAMALASCCIFLLSAAYVSPTVLLQAQSARVDEAAREG